MDGQSTIAAMVAVAVSAAFASTVHAQFGATAVVDPPLPATNPEDPTAAGTVVQAHGDRPRALETTADALAEVPAAQTRETGDLGSFTGLSIRGADLDHTTVLFGDLPLGPDDGGAFDLSTIPLSLLERIEVYRGGAPLLLGGSGIGGVVRLVPRESQGTLATGTVGVGSFGRREARAAASVRGADGSPAVTTLVGWRHTDGDYPYLHVSGAGSLDPGGGEVRRRQNGKLDEGYGLMHAHLDLLGGRLELLGVGYGRTGGLTGSPVEEPTHTHRQLVRAIGGLAWQRRWQDTSRPSRLRLSMAVGEQRNRLTDLFGEITLVPRATDDRTTRLLARADGDVQLADWLTVAALISHDFERFAPEDPLAALPPRTSVRNTTTAGIEGRFTAKAGGVRGELRASAEMQVSSVHLVDIQRDTAGQTHDRTIVAPVLRVGLSVEPVRGLALTASAANATRLPTVLELFGDRGFILGDTGLAPERATMVDGGIVLKGRAGTLHGSAEARGFGMFARDLIQFQRTAWGQLAPINVAGATIVGLEAGLRGGWGRHVHLVGSLTWMRTHNRQLGGRELPLRPALSAYVRPEIAIGGVGVLTCASVYADITHVSRDFVDPHDVAALPARTLVGTGVAFDLFNARVRLTVSVRDLFDTQPFDLVGFPLPGRTISAELTVRTEGDPP